MTAKELSEKIIDSFILKLISLKVGITIDEELKQKSINEIAKDIEQFAIDYNKKQKS